MDCLDCIGRAQIEDVVIALDQGRPVRESLATIAGLIELEILNLCAHCPVKDQDAVSTDALKRGLPVCTRRHAANSRAGSPGFTPSK